MTTEENQKKKQKKKFQLILFKHVIIYTFEQHPVHIQKDQVLITAMKLRVDARSPTENFNLFLSLTRWFQIQLFLHLSFHIFPFSHIKCEIERNKSKNISPINSVGVHCLPSCAPIMHHIVGVPTMNSK